MTISKTLAGALAVALMGGAATSALASGLPGVPVITPSDLPTGGATFGATDFTSQFNSMSGSGAGSATLGDMTAGAALIVPDITVSGAIGSGVVETHASAAASFTENFVISGTPGAVVPIIIQGVATGSGSGDGLAFAQVGLEPFNDSRDEQIVFQFNSCNSSCGGAFDKSYNVLAGVTYSVVLSASGEFLTNPTATVSSVGAFSAEVDPPSLISISPTFLDQNPGFSLVTNDGLVPPTPGVPEPASWALMIAGFGLAGSMLRRRRTLVSAA